MPVRIRTNRPRRMTGCKSARARFNHASNTQAVKDRGAFARTSEMFDILGDRDHSVAPRLLLFNDLHLKRRPLASRLAPLDRFDYHCEDTLWTPYPFTL